tara:strand:+ start:1034 stop:1198 length:165 start_codon:yes stop_codon:yes gene_type:complete
MIEGPNIGWHEKTTTRVTRGDEVAVIFRDMIQPAEKEFGIQKFHESKILLRSIT